MNFVVYIFDTMTNEVALLSVLYLFYFYLLFPSAQYQSLTTFPLCLEYTSTLYTVH